jgi:predicted nucleic acid-binding protein
LFLLTAIAILVLFDEPRALAAATSLGLWVAGMAAVVTYSAYADLSRKAASP